MAKPQLTYIYHNHSTKTVIAVTAKSRTFADKEAVGATYISTEYGAIEANRTANAMGYKFHPIQLF